MKDLKFIHITKCAGTFIEDLGSKQGIKWGRFHKEYGSWHRLFKSVPKRIRAKYDWFVVVRNPYDRMLSEYYCIYGGTDQFNHTKEEFNKYIQMRIKRRSKKGDHFTEQSKYLEGAISPIYVVKFEKLNQGLKQLFKLYNLKIKIPTTKKNVGRKGKFSIRDFDRRTLDLINKVYDKDFEIFNYKKV